MQCRKPQDQSLLANVGQLLCVIFLQVPGQDNDMQNAMLAVTLQPMSQLMYAPVENKKGVARAVVQNVPC